MALSKVSKIWVDPEYGKQSGHDVAVLTLATPFDGVPTLALETDKAADNAGAASVVYGWGETEGTGPANTFQKAKVGTHLLFRLYGSLHKSQRRHSSLTNGFYMTENRRLIKDVLKGEWGFDGVYMSDWSATHDAIANRLPDPRRARDQSAHRPVHRPPDALSEQKCVIV